MSGRGRDEGPALRLVSRPAILNIETTSPVVVAPRPVLDDAEILAAIGRGDESAAGALHDRVRPLIDRTIVRLIGRHDEDHDDLAQLSMIEIVRSIGRFRGECSLDTWTMRITAHTVYKELRRRRAERRVLDTSADIEGPRVLSGDLDRDVTLRSALVRVRAHLDGMDVSKSWTVLLHDVCGHDLREIAQITEVTVAAAQTRLVRGRRELHERLQNDPELRDILEQLGSRR